MSMITIALWANFILQFVWFIYVIVKDLSKDDNKIPFKKGIRYE